MLFPGPTRLGPWYLSPLVGSSFLHKCILRCGCKGKDEVRSVGWGGQKAHTATRNKVGPGHMLLPTGKIPRLPLPPPASLPQPRTPSGPPCRQHPAARCPGRACQWTRTSAWRCPAGCPHPRHHPPRRTPGGVAQPEESGGTRGWRWRRRRHRHPRRRPRRGAPGPRTGPRTCPRHQRRWCRRGQRPQTPGRSAWGTGHPPPWRREQRPPPAKPTNHGVRGGGERRQRRQ
jgi:hypothetical protein